MGLIPNTTASLREGIGSINGTLVLTEVLSCTIVSIIAITFFFAPHWRWHTNPVLKLFLFASGTPVDKMLSYTLGLMQSIDNELHLVWAIFLVIAYGSLLNSAGYSIYIDRKDRRAFETAQFLDNFYVATLIASFPRHSKFKRPLWALLCLIFVKSIQRIISFHVANRRYGTDNINLVADYMSYEHELTNRDEVNPTHMKGYNYLVVGEDEAKAKRQKPEYVLRLDVMDEKVITVDKVWQCEGGLLCSSGKLGRRLKDVCLSFALFKLLGRRFFDYSAAEANHAKTRDFVFRGLLEGEDHKRVFRVIKVELEFLHDLFCTKYPIIFSFWFSILCVLHLFIIIVSAWTAVRALRNYEIHKNDHSEYRNNVDAIITYVFVVLIMIMEAWEFCRYWLSNWAKVMLTCKYAKQHKRVDFLHLDKILKIICRGKLWSRLSDEIGQYSLLENFRYNNFNIPYYVTCGFAADKKGKGVRKQNPVKLSGEVKKAIFRSLKNGGGFSNGKLSLQRNEVSTEIFWACTLPSHTHTIMVWHIATSHFEMMESHDNVDHQQDTEDREVATKLSRYCAYLLVFAPELLPVSSFAVKYLFEEIVTETRTFFEDCKRNDSMGKKVIEYEGPADTIIKMGAKLAKQLMDVEVGRRWRILAEFWAELMLFLAPSDNAWAHKEKLETGGEFITHLWALLYHAGILEQPQSSHGDTVTASSVYNMYIHV